MESILNKLLEQNKKIERDISRLGTLEDGEICSEVKQKYKVDLIINLCELSKLQDTNLNNYYLCISKSMNKLIYKHSPIPKDRYYVYSCHPIYVDDRLIYEITLGMASDYASKFNRFIVF